MYPTFTLARVGIDNFRSSTFVFRFTAHLDVDAATFWAELNGPAPLYRCKLLREVALILEFTVYWVIQTIELWRTPNRFELLPEADQPQLAQRRRTRGPAGLLPEVVEATRPPVRERLLTAL